MNIEFNGLRQSKGPLYYAGTALSDLIEESSDQMLLKDVQTGKYLLCSPLTATLLGVKVNDLIGLTIDDLAARDGIWSQWDFSPQFIVWKNKEPEVIKRLDHQVQATQHPVSRCHVTFTHEGFIRFKQTVKRPVFNRNTHKVIAVLSFAKNLTVQKSLPDLLKLYQLYYPEQDAIQKCLMYLEIDGYFNQLPALDEMHVLFSIQQFSDCSETAHPVYSSLKDKVDVGFWDEMCTRLQAIPSPVSMRCDA